ncbi:C40 family peptidase [Paenibacillus sp. 1P07SE]|uniref:C40 family peptidase n=1 Tax=Paenibacillus sp. 1P07SE TaxID=3132209 RepID=UPI0039A6076C
MINKKRLYPRRRAALLAVCCALLAAQLGGCGAGARQTEPQEQGTTEMRLLAQGQSAVEIFQLDGLDYVDIGQMAQQIGFKTIWSEDRREYLIGDHDIIWRFAPDSRKANKEEQDTEMEAPARKRENSLAIPVASLQPLFGDEAVFAAQEEDIIIFPSPDYKDPEAEGGESFADDPQDPSKEPEPVQEQEEGGEQQAGQTGRQDREVLKALVTNGGEIVQEAKRYDGVPYLFGASPYSSSKRFDCSSFTRYIYAKFGHSLARTARAQAQKGTYVPRSALRVGDLMYFYVPGRFKSNKKVGHVGIYMGNQKMIHSSPLPEDGVQVTDINKAYWKQTFLYAKRLAD